MKRVINRIMIVLPAIILQISWYVLILKFLHRFFPVINFILSLLSIIVVLYILTKQEEPTYRMTWLIIIILFPVLGTWFYLFVGNKRFIIKLEKRMNKVKLKKPEKTKDEINKELEKENKRLFQSLNYVSKNTSFPITYSNKSKYYKVGEEMYKDMLIDLKNAKETIYLEYFILKRGEFLDSIVEILKEKVKEGLDVRVMYDYLGSIATYSIKSALELNKSGIKCTSFNPLFFINPSLNNRDHRKMMIIDSNIAYSGGINISDEYINLKHPFGHWKDIGFRITGEEVNSYSYMFSKFWNAFSPNKIREINYQKENKNTNNGYVLSYYDTPAIKTPLSNDLYIDLLSQSKDKVYFYTPYLILGDNLMETLIRTAKRGVEINIIVPGIPDKKLINRITKSYYKTLIDNNINIYEYKDGFVHAKATLFDNSIGTIGTVNLDYRSLFLHYENNSIFYKTNMVNELEKDFKDSIEKSKKMTKKDINNKIMHRLVDSVLRIIAPLC